AAPVATGALLSDPVSVPNRCVSGSIRQSGQLFMSVVDSFVPTPLIFTDAAAAKVKELVEDEGNPDLKLRVYVTGGGCSGFQYGFSFDEELAEDDTVITNQGVNLVVDPMSYQYLVGATVD